MYTRVTTRFHRILILLNYFSVCTPISPTLLTIACFWSLQMTRRMRLPFWLLHHLDNDTFPGVCWIDQANGIFQLPWCHRAHKEFSTERSQLFLSWGILKGRIDAQTAISNSMLLAAKATFRCAINVCDCITALPAYDKTRVGADSYRVFQYTTPPDELDVAIALLDISESCAAANTLLSLHKHVSWDTFLWREKVYIYICVCVCERHIIIYKQMTLNAHFFSFSHEQRANNLQLLQMQTKKQPLQAAEPLCEMSDKKISIRSQSTPHGRPWVAACRGGWMREMLCRYKLPPWTAP